MSECGAVLGWGNTLDEAMAHCQKAADTIKGYGIKMPSGSIEEAKKQMEEINESGLKVFSLDKSEK